MIKFNHEEGREFDGIMLYLTRKTGGNIRDNGTIEIKSNSLYNNSFHPKCLVDYDKSSIYQSKDELGVFIVFDFKDREIQLTSYSLKSSDYEANWGHLRNWKLEVSQDVENWTPVDEHINDKTLNGRNIIATFNAKPTKSFYRFVKLEQTGESWNKYDKHYRIYFPYIEFYGKIRCK